MNAEQIKAIAIEEGASLVGIADLSDIEKLPYPRLNKALSIAVRLSDEIMDEVALKNTPTHPYFHQYRTANAYIDQVVFRIGLKLQQAGLRVVQVAASQSIAMGGSGYQGLFSHRAAAIRAGLGWIGKSNALVTAEYGPRVRLGTLLFEGHEISTDTPIHESKCGHCQACVRICPAYALTGEAYVKGIEREAIVDVRACSEHMHAAYQHIGRGVVCGLCIAICPVGRKQK